jgi:hypothetical protein
MADLKIQKINGQTLTLISADLRVYSKQVRGNASCRIGYTDVQLPLIGMSACL